MQGLMQDGWPLCVTKIIDHAARWHGEQEVISRTVEGPTTTTTYRELRERAALCTLALRRLGVRPGDRVATLAWNTSRHLECWYGIAGAGAVCHTLNPRLFDKELDFIVNHSAAAVVLADVGFEALLARMAPRWPGVTHIIMLTQDRHMPKEPSPLGPAAVLCYEDLLEAELPGLPSFAWTLAAETDACGLCYTSGTTGDPKGVLYSHRSNFLHALAIALPDSLDLHSDTTFLMVVPMFHAWGLAFAAPMVGARLVLPGPALDGPSVHALMLAHGVTHTAGVPTVWLGLMQHLRGRRAGVPGLRLMIVGGAACPRALVDYFEGQHGVEVRQAWGMTELSPCGTLAAMKGPLAGALDSQGVAALKLSQGRPHVFLDMRVVGEGGNELPHDGASFGDLQVRGPIAVRRYFRGAAPATDADGWFDTGDVGTVDAHGYMRITDRSKDVIKSGGEWISSIEIENLAVGHPGVAEAAVIGLPDDKWGERPLLVVVPQAGGQRPTREELLSFLEGKIARWWMPDDVAFVEQLPHTATGKISKLRLRQQFKGYAPAGRPRAKL